MYIKRDLAAQLEQASACIQILLCPRQCGKSTLFASLTAETKGRPAQEVTFDDLQLRQLANRDPALFLQQFESPLLLDEVQYVPNLFPQLKKRTDEAKRAVVFCAKNLSNPKALFRLTGSNQI